MFLDSQSMKTDHGITASHLYRGNCEVANISTGCIAQVQYRGYCLGAMTYFFGSVAIISRFRRSVQIKQILRLDLLHVFL
jgi:hypothetical protein